MVRRTRFRRRWAAAALAAVFLVAAPGRAQPAPPTPPTAPAPAAPHTRTRLADHVILDGAYTGLVVAMAGILTEGEGGR